MAICPACHRKDKNFFAPQCHSCNTEIGFNEQVFHSILWTMLPMVIWLVLFYLFIAIVT